MIGRIKKLYKLLPPLLSRDIKERYAGSALGIFWTFLQPLLFILIYWMVFSKIMKIRVQTDTGDVPFFAFLLSGHTSVVCPSGRRYHGSNGNTG